MSLDYCNECDGNVHIGLYKGEKYYYCDSNDCNFRILYSKVKSELKKLLILNQPCNIFINEEKKELGIYIQSRYHDDERYIKQIQFSKKIWDFRNSETTSMIYFENLIDDLLTEESFVLVCVPSHEAGNKNEVHELVSRLAEYGQRIDGSNCLIRYKTVESVKHGGDRSLSTHRNSIEVGSHELVFRRSILLIDDITTTGNSLSACKSILENAGAFEVKTLVLGRTMRGSK